MSSFSPYIFLSKEDVPIMYKDGLIYSMDSYPYQVGECMEFVLQEEYYEDLPIDPIEMYISMAKDIVIRYAVIPMEKKRVLENLEDFKFLIKYVTEISEISYTKLEEYIKKDYENISAFEDILSTTMEVIENI